MSSNAGAGALDSTILKQLRDFWFEGQPKKLSIEEPVVKVCMQRWYQGGKEVDDLCRSVFIVSTSSLIQHGLTLKSA